MNVEYSMAAPVYGVNTTGHTSVKAGGGPIDNPFYPTRLYRLPMEVINVIVKVGLSSPKMLPKPPLPQTPLSSFCSTLRESLAFFEGTAKGSFKPVPSGGKIRVIRRQRPHAMERIRQANHRLQPAGSPFLGLHKSQVHQIDLIDQPAVISSLGEINREKPHGTRNRGTAIVGHEFRLTLVCLSLETMRFVPQRILRRLRGLDFQDGSYEAPPKAAGSIRRKPARSLSKSPITGDEVLKVFEV